MYHETNIHVGFKNVFPQKKHLSISRSVNFRSIPGVTTAGASAWHEYSDFILHNTACRRHYSHRHLCHWKEYHFSLFPPEAQLGRNVSSYCSWIYISLSPVPSCFFLALLSTFTLASPPVILWFTPNLPTAPHATPHERDLHGSVPIPQDPCSPLHPAPGCSAYPWLCPWSTACPGLAWPAESLHALAPWLAWDQIPGGTFPACFRADHASSLSSSGFTGYRGNFHL